MKVQLDTTRIAEFRRQYLQLREQVRVYKDLTNVERRTIYCNSISRALTNPNLRLTNATSVLALVETTKNDALEAPSRTQFISAFKVNDEWVSTSFKIPQYEILHEFFSNLASAHSLGSPVIFEESDIQLVRSFKQIAVPDPQLERLKSQLHFIHNFDINYYK